MYYYRITTSDGAIGYQSRTDECESEYLTEITENEYNAAVAELEEKLTEADIPTYDDLQNRIEELEEENAALLFQNLTGEVISDV